MYFLWSFRRIYEHIDYFRNHPKVVILCLLKCQGGTRPEGDCSAVGALAEFMGWHTGRGHRVIASTGSIPNK